MPRRSKLEIRDDEQVVFFPTIGQWDAAAGAWHVPIHAWIFRPEVDSRRRAMALGLLRRWLNLEPEGAVAGLFEERLRAFLVDNRAKRIVTIQVRGEPFQLAPSAKNGHIQDHLQIPASLVDEHLAHAFAVKRTPVSDERWLEFGAVMPADSDRTIRGAIQLLGEEGLSVISDIDDTIKITHVHDRTALLRQTFLREFEPVPGMAELYTQWRTGGAAFHYVSRSPWQLYAPLADFVRARGFPVGTFHMRNFRWKNASTLQPDRHGAKKLAVIEEIFTSQHRRQFACVGDSGEHDPEIYGELARRFPDRVRAIFIRNVSGESRDAPRFARAFAGIVEKQWQVFDDPSELPTKLS